MSLVRTVKPKNARSKRAMDARAPKIQENPKKTLFIRGQTASQLTETHTTDLFAFKIPLSKKFTKKNAILPFEDATALEFFAQKNDTSLLVFTSNNKKRPHNVTFVRTFNYKVLDMYELGITGGDEGYRSLSSFKTAKPAVGMKPMLLFNGAIWDTTEVYKGLKSYFLDFFKGEDASRVAIEGLQFILTFTVSEVTDATPLPKIHFRGYRIVTKRSGQKLPRVELEEMGPRVDWSVRRVQLPEENMWKEATAKPKKSGEARTKKNITTDIMGDKLGRIHLGKQEIEKMQTRKMKGLKRRKGEDDDGDVSMAEAKPKKSKKVDAVEE
ncbi:ribosome biogenesis protein-like protein RPF2 [Ascobolus immersus RN42]|uniref:Ribosome production factor 2 homolog n=1 Tax=Ascobolus immersus RN42 TaxID=1160509 RepID=A0A3N4HY14_ASCIM|nr:ribosome biogenesis protein-like protein RPF2 [Ascobolus immersus RN42]